MDIFFLLLSIVLFFALWIGDFVFFLSLSPIHARWPADALALIFRWLGDCVVWWIWGQGVGLGQPEKEHCGNQSDGDRPGHSEQEFHFDTNHINYEHFFFCFSCSRIQVISLLFPSQLFFVSIFFYWGLQRKCISYNILFGCCWYCSRFNGTYIYSNEGCRVGGRVGEGQAVCV